MRHAFYLWASFLIFSLVLSGLSLRALSLRGLAYYDSLIVRGLFCLVVVAVFAGAKKLSLWPRSFRTQALRGVLAGIALSAFTLSYSWLSASAVAVLSNIDVPLLLALGPVVGIASHRSTRVLSGFSISFLVLYVVIMDPSPTLYLGISVLALGSLLLCVGYLYIKKSMKDENEAVTILVPSVAIIVYGLLQGQVSVDVSVPWSASFTAWGLISGLSMFMAYFATMKLYHLTDLASAEFPTLVSSVVIQPFEVFILNEKFSFTHLALSVLFITAVYLILVREKRLSYA